MQTIHYPNRIRYHLVTIVPMAPFIPKSTSKLWSALHFRYSIVIPRFILALIRLNFNSHYNHGFHNTFDYKHFIYSDSLICTVLTLYVKGECSVFLKKNYIMDENDSLSEYIKIPLGHNRANGAVYSKFNFKVEQCSAP